MPPGIARRRKTVFLPPKPDQLFQTVFQVAVSVDQTDAILVEAVHEKQHGSIEAVVAAEIQSNLESVSYVKRVCVIRTTQEGRAMTVKFFPNEKGNPPGKLADAELHFSGGPLNGLKLVGFGIWERKGGSRNVTFPARQYSVNGERRSFALLRPIVDATSQDKLRDIVLEAYKEHEAEMAATG
jgi:hypothetical protein